MKIYMYRTNYQYHDEDLCALDMRGLFGVDFYEKVFLSRKLVDPSLSPFIKHRLEIIHRSDSFEYLLHLIETKVINAQGFNVVYAPFFKNDPYSRKGKFYSKEIGLRIIGIPSFKSPSIVYGITYYKGQWCFGVLQVNEVLWDKHLNKPFSYSSSLGIHMAKVLLNVVTQGDRTKKIIDPCCGVGTVLLEGANVGYNIEGREIKAKVAKNAEANLAFYGYDVKVTTGDIKDIEAFYDGVIIDLPYGNFSHTTAEDIDAIITHANRIGKRSIIVASGDIRELLLDNGLHILDSCKVGKNQKGEFARYVFLCKSRETTLIKNKVLDLI